FELLICFHDDQDEAIPLVNKLCERYPKVDVKVFIGGAKGVVNPMVQNMVPAYDAAQYEYIWISSSRIEASDVILLDMASRLQKSNVALVHQIPFTTDSPGFGSTVEKIYFGTALARYYIAFNMLGICCVTGMSYIFKKTILDQVNGLAWYGCYLAEDFFLTHALHERGQIVLSAIPAKQNVGQTMMCGFVDRMVRWVRLRLNMMPVVTGLLEPLTDCFPLGVYTSWALHHFFNISPLSFFTVHVLLWMTLDYILLTSVQNGPLLFSKLEFVQGWVVRELSSTYVFFKAIINPHYIRWGHRTFHVKMGGLTELVQDSSKLYFYKAPQAFDKGDYLPGVSIIKPVMGLHPHLEENLESHFTLTYPKFELLFCFHDKKDQAIPLVFKLQERYPTVHTKVFIGDSKKIINPMVQNMAPAYMYAQYEYIWISSSRVEATNEALLDMLVKLQKPDVALVHQMPITTESHGFDSIVEKIYFGAALAKSYIAFSMLGICCIVGMSYTFKKSLLDEANGLPWYGRFLSEDFYLSRALYKKGRIVLSAFPAKQNCGHTTFGGFLDRMVRWLRLRLTMTTFTAAILEPVSDCFPLGGLAVWALGQFSDMPAFNVFIVHVLTWIVLDYILLTGMQNGPPSFSVSSYVTAWLARELSAMFIYIVALSDLHHVRWGQKTFHVQFGGLVESSIQSIIRWLGKYKGRPRHRESFTRVLFFFSENCKKALDCVIPKTDTRHTRQKDKSDLQWGFKFYNSSSNILKKGPGHTKFVHLDVASISCFEKDLKNAFDNFETGISSKSCNHASELLSKALTEILHDFSWIENDYFASPVSRKKSNFQLEEGPCVKKMVFLITRSPSSQRGLRRFSNKVIMDADVFLDSFMSPALLNEYQNKFKISVNWIDMTAESCRSIYDTERDLQAYSRQQRGLIVVSGADTGMQSFFQYLPVESCLYPILRKDHDGTEAIQVHFSGRLLNDLTVHMVPLTKLQDQSKESKAESFNLKNTSLTLLGCVPMKDVSHLLLTKVLASYVIDCSKNDQLANIHSLILETNTLGVLSLTKGDQETSHLSMLQPFANGIAMLSLLNSKESFHGEKKLLNPLPEEGSCFKRMKSHLLMKFTNSTHGCKNEPVKEDSEVTTESVYQSHYMNSWYMPGSLPGMSSLISRLKLRSGNLDSTTRSDKSFLKELRKHYIKEKQPLEVVQNFQPSTSTPICAVRKKKTDSADSETSSKSSKVSVRSLRSSTLSRGRLMVDRARSASILTAGDTDTSLMSASDSPDRKSRNSNTFIDIDLANEQDLKIYLLKQYEQLLSASIAIESTVRAMLNVTTRFMNSIQHSNPQVSAADLIRQLLMKNSKELKDKYSQRNMLSDKNTKIAEYKFQILLLLELEFVTKNDDSDGCEMLNELTLLLRGLMFLTDAKYLNDFLTDSIIVSYSAALPKLLADVYDELMLPLPPALNKFASPMSAKAPMSVYNEDSFLSAPGSTQPSSHLSDQASQQTRRSRFKQHPSISDFRHSKQILVKAKPKAEVKSTTKEKAKVKVRSSRRRHTAPSVSADVGKAKRNLFSEKITKTSQSRTHDEVKSSHKKKSRHSSGRSKTLVIGTPAHKQTSHRFLRQQERRRQSENIDPEVKVIAESPLKEDEDDPSLASALTKSAKHLLRESFYSTSSQPSRNFSRSLELSQRSSSQLNLSQESQFQFSRSQGTLSSAIRGDSPHMSPRTRFMKSFIFSPSPTRKAKSLLRRSPRKSSKKLDFKAIAGQSAAADAQLIFDGENANDFNLMISPTRRKSTGAVGAGYKTPEKQIATSKANLWETASCPPLMVTPVKNSSHNTFELSFKNIISQSEGRNRLEPSGDKTPVKNMVLRSTPTRMQKTTVGFSTPVKSVAACHSAAYKTPEKITDFTMSPSGTKSQIMTRSFSTSNFHHATRKIGLSEHPHCPSPRKQFFSESVVSPERHSTPTKVKFSNVDLSYPLVGKVPPSAEKATPRKSILKNSPLVKDGLLRAARRVELQTVSTPVKCYSFLERSMADNKVYVAVDINKQEDFISRKYSLTDVSRLSLEPEKSFSSCSLRDTTGGSGKGTQSAAVTVRTPSPSCKKNPHSINSWDRRKKCSPKHSSPSSGFISSPRKTAAPSAQPIMVNVSMELLDTPKKAGSNSEIKHPRKRSLFLLDDVAESPSKRAKNSSPKRSAQSCSLVRTDTYTFNPVNSSPSLYDDDDDRDVCGNPGVGQPSVLSQASQLSFSSCSGSQAASLPQCVFTPVKRSTRLSSALEEGSQGFPVFPSSVSAELSPRTRHENSFQTNVSSKECAEKIDCPQQQLGFSSEKKQFSPLLSEKGLRSLIDSPMFSRSGDTQLSSPVLAKLSHSKSRKHLNLQ
ncbi:hypothetical protein Btru_073116, partial [Bulinus truncatus]